MSPEAAKLFSDLAHKRVAGCMPLAALDVLELTDSDGKQHDRPFTSSGRPLPDTAF